MLLIDNYDSFTYNLVQAFAALGADVVVHRNDAIDVESARALEPTHLVISPGPGRPDDAGVSMAMIEAFVEQLPILGVCLGHQCIGQAYGGRVVRAERPMHGKTSLVRHDETGLFAGLPNPLEATRYHSLVIAEDSLPECLEVCARTDDQEIMAVRHRELPIRGVQFHPESILTGAGKRLLANFLSGCHAEEAA